MYETHRVLVIYISCLFHSTLPFSAIIKCKLIVIKLCSCVLVIMRQLFSKFMKHMSNMLNLMNLFNLVWYGRAPKVAELWFITIILSFHTLTLLTSWESAEDQNLNEGFIRTVIIDCQLWLMLGILSITLCDRYT